MSALKLRERGRQIGLSCLLTVCNITQFEVKIGNASDVDIDLSTECQRDLVSLPRLLGVRLLR